MSAQLAVHIYITARKRYALASQTISRKEHLSRETLEAATCMGYNHVEEQREAATIGHRRILHLLQKAEQQLIIGDH